MQAYRSGHNEAVLKTVWVKAHGGSNPSSCATQREGKEPSFFLRAQEESKKKARINGGSRERAKTENKEKREKFF